MMRRTSSGTFIVGGLAVIAILLSAFTAFSFRAMQNRMSSVLTGDES